MTVFCDSSALVKLYADELGNETIRAIVSPIVVSALCRVEVPSAVWRKQRGGELGADDARVLVSSFEDDYHGMAGRPPLFAAVAPGPALLDDAATLVAVHGLRAYDAIQLASALAVRTEFGECDSFAAFDIGLCEAAAAEGFTLVGSV